MGEQDAWGLRNNEHHLKTDFMRKWHHNCSGKPISLDEMMEREDEDIFEVADLRIEFEQTAISEM